MKNDRTPWLSIIIPVYNAERSLEACVDAILKQQFTDYEVLLIDDGSTDHSLQICRNYSKTDQRIHVFSQKNCGPFQARIYGVEHSCGEYVTFCDADDYYSRKDAFDRIKRTAERYNPDVIQFNFRIKYNHLSRIHKSVNAPLYYERDRFLENEYPVFLCGFFDNAHLTHNVWNKVYRRRLLDALPPYETAERLFWGDDLVTNLISLKECSSVAVIPDTLYVYKDTTGGTTRFSKNAMKDLNVIKKYQTLYLRQSNDHRKEALLSTIHTETACWLGAWIKEGVHIVEREELINLIDEALSLPEIEKARRYFLETNHLNWQAVELLRKGDPHQYIEWACTCQNETKGLKDKIKTIYKSI